MDIRLTVLAIGDFEIETGVKLKGCALPLLMSGVPVSLETVNEGVIGVDRFEEFVRALNGCW